MFDGEKGADAMYLTRHQTADGPRWAADGRFLPLGFELGFLLQVPASAIPGLLLGIPRTSPARGPLLAPLEAIHEVWASGVTYLRSREAREAESTVKDVPQALPSRESRATRRPRARSSCR